MKKLLFSLLVFLPFLIQAQEPVREFQNGQVWTGKIFSPATFWTVGGKITFKKPAQPAAETFDLTEKWVVPAFGDAASQNFDGSMSLDFVIKNHLEEGFFYAAQLGNSQKARAEMAQKVNAPDGPDVLFSNGPITCPSGEPSGQIELRALQTAYPSDWEKRVNAANRNPILFDDGYFFVENEENLNAKWPKILAMKPDFLLVSLRDAKNEARKGSIRPEMAKIIAKRAHKAKLRVFANIETADDFRAGLEAGVDGFVNLPGAIWDGKKEAERARFELLPADIKKAKKKKVFVVPTYVRSQSLVGEMTADGQFFTDTARQRRVREVQKINLRRLAEAGVPLALGVDEATKSTRSEVMYLQQLGALTNEQILRALCETTPTVLFPKRKIGALKEGFEGNFVALTGPPLANLLNTRRIELAVKQGRIVKNQLKKG